MPNMRNRNAWRHDADQRPGAAFEAIVQRLIVRRLQAEHADIVSEPLPKPIAALLDELRRRGLIRHRADQGA